MSVLERPLALRFPLHGSRLIEASAGTGKTWTIAALYLRLVLGHGDNADHAALRPCVPSEILVMTFTKAATRELSERIRSRLGRLVEHPHDVEVRVHGGHVQLKGHVSEDEFHELLHAVSSMRGVQNLESLLRTHPAHSMQTSAPH